MTLEEFTALPDEERRPLVDRALEDVGRMAAAEAVLKEKALLHRNLFAAMIAITTHPDCTDEERLMVSRMVNMNGQPASLDEFKERIAASPWRERPMPWREERLAHDRQKRALLDHYAGKEPKRFVQYDGEADMRGDMLDGDGDGFVVTCQETEELMRGADVRVLIPFETTKEDALELLRQITHSIEETGIYRRETVTV